MRDDYSSFCIPSILMGIAIAIDVALATLARYRYRDKSMEWVTSAYFDYWMARRKI